MPKINPARWLKYKYLNFLRIKDRPASIATGAALGLSFDILPTFGLGVLVAYFLATLLKVNRVATVISAVVFKLCIPLFTYLNVVTGSIIMNEPLKNTAQAGQHFMLEYDWSALGLSFLVGSVINAALAYAVSYAATYYFVCWRRKRAGAKTPPIKVHSS